MMSERQDDGECEVACESKRVTGLQLGAQTPHGNCHNIHRRICQSCTIVSLHCGDAEQSGLAAQNRRPSTASAQVIHAEPR